MKFHRTARRVGTAVCVVAALGWLPAQASAMSLQQAYELARQNDRQWRLAQARLREVQELMPIARGQLLPQVSASASKSYIQQEQTTAGIAIPKQSYPSDSQGVTLRQPLLRLRQVRALDQARAQVEQAFYVLRHEEQQLVVRVVASYLDALLAQDRQRLIDGQLVLVNNRLAAAEAGLRSGQGTRNDVDDARAERDRIKAQAIQIDQGILLTRRQVELLTGAPPGVFDVLNLSTFAPAHLEAPALTEALDTALRENPQVMAAREELRVAESGLRQAEANHLPSLDLVAQIGKSTGENSFFASTSTTSKSVGVQFSIPLYTGGTITAQVRQAASKLEQANETLEQVSNRTRLEVQTEHNSVVQGRALIDALRTAVVSANEAVNSSRRGQAAGVRTLLDVLRAESQLFQADLDLAQARYTYLVSWVKLQALMGRLKSEVVPKVSALFSPR